MPLPFPQLQLPEGLVDVAVARRTVDRNQRADRMRAERLRKGDFLFRSGPRNCDVRCAEEINELPGKQFDQRLAIILSRRNNLRQRRPPQDRTPRKPLRKAARAFPLSFAGS